MIREIIFDLDDTLIHSGRYFVETTMKTSEAMGLSIPGRKEILRYANSWDDFILETWPSVPLDEYKRVYKSLAEEIKYEIIDGVNPALEALGGNYNLYILSRRPREMLDLRLLQTSLRTDLFKGIYCSEDVKYHKPDPRTFDEIVEDSRKYGIHEEEILSVGDSHVDMEASLKRGLEFVAVLTGDYEKPHFVALGLREDCILESAARLPEYLSAKKPNGQDR